MREPPSQSPVMRVEVSTGSSAKARISQPTRSGLDQDYTGVWRSTTAASPA